MESKNVFSTDGCTYRLTPNMKTEWPLETAIYNLQFDERHNECYLQKYLDKFQFDFTRYEIDEEFIQHALLRYKSMTHNMGILLNGTKGAGKSVIAKTIANEVGIPVIIVSKNYPELINFMSKISFPCVWFFDEFEKTFFSNEISDQSQSLLSIMDGVYTGNIPHLFLLTTNSLKINENFLSRPGRVLYCRTYKSLSEDIIKRFISDNIEDKTIIPELFEIIQTLDIVTIDILRAICDEINVTKISPKKAFEYLNIQKVKIRYHVSYYYSNRSNKSDSGYNFEQFKKDLECLDFIDSNRFKNTEKIVERYGEDWYRPDIDFSLVESDLRLETMSVGDTFDDNIIEEFFENKKYLKCVDKYGSTLWYRIEKQSSGKNNIKNLL